MTTQYPFTAMAEAEQAQQQRSRYAPQQQIDAALKVAQDCVAHATNEHTAQIHLTAVMVLRIAKADVLPADCAPALDKALSQYTPKAVTPDGETVYTFRDDGVDFLIVDPPMQIDEAEESYDGALPSVRIDMIYVPNPDDERDAALDIQAAEDAAREAE